MTIIEAGFVYNKVVNFAMQQNHVPVARKLSIKNIGDKDLNNLTIEIISNPDFTIPYTLNIGNLNKGEQFDLNIIPIKIQSKYLAELTERIAGDFNLIVYSAGEIVFKEHYNVDVLAYDQWNGVNVLPELITAFITPNHPEIQRIIKRAAEILGKWTGNPSFDEYQSQNPDRVRKQMACIYEAIAELQIVYCAVPASFEEAGQRIRLCDTIFTHKLGNCIDLSLLYAACLEAIGINPFIIIIKGHAFTGGWLINECFADAVNDDASLLTKRMAEGINETILIEATCMNAGNNISFDESVKQAANKLIKEEDFILFVDVKRARFSGIRPLPLRIQTAQGWEIIEAETKDRNNNKPEEIYTGNKIIDVEKIDVSKQKLWERKLLDLTLRNNLLNLRITKSNIQFISFDAGKLEDALANGDEFQILSKPTDWENPLRSAGVYQSLNTNEPITDLIKHELAQKRLRTYLTENELTLSLTNLYRSSRLSMEENGANTLYIALGLLKWYETNASEKPRYAPILLIPVEIIKKSAQKGYIIRSREEETMMNITLLEMLRHDHGINIGGLEILPKDESGIDVRAVFNIVRQSIMSKSKWDVEEQVFLGTFSFSKFILWNDIHNNADKLLKNKVVASLVSGKLEWQPELENNNNESFDTLIQPSEIALPISTDSSQLHAIVNSSKNESFVLHGPPGTGKSQTITNIIANALYAGKKVLFVAAKRAALEVVQTRLEKIGIAAFCLELHSNKSKKTAVLEQLKKAAEVTKKSSPESFKSESERLFEIRSGLNNYVQALHKKHAFGFSLFDVFSKYAELKGVSDKIQFNTSSINILSEKKLVEWNDLVEEIQAVGSICTHPHNHPLEAINIKQYSQQVKQDGKQQIIDYLALLHQHKTITQNVCKALKVEIDIITKTQNETLKDLSELILTLPDIPASIFNIDNVEQTMAQVIGIAEHGNKRDVLRSQLLQQFNKSILLFNAQETLSDWNIAEQKWFLPKWLKQKSIKTLLKKQSLNGTIETPEIAAALQTIINYQEEQQIIEKASYLPLVLGFLWQNGDCEWNKLTIICHALIKINRLAISLNGTAKIKDWRNAIAIEFIEGSNAYLSINGKALQDYTKLQNAIAIKENQLKNFLGINFSALKSITENWIDNSIEHANKWLLNIEQLKDWSSWIQVKDKAIATGLLPVISVYENGGIESKDVILQYKKGLYRSLAEFIIDKEPQLSSFNGKLFEEKIKKFRQISNDFEQLTKEELYAKLAAKIPSFTQEAAQSSEIGILQKMIRNNGRATSIRKLFDSIPNLLPRLCPCMLMSPISVAQYFDANSTRFDLVVFDEASQLPTCEAVGAIARGTNVIVVGDPKQMPPTSFFSTNNIDEDNIENEDLESILDDCLALSMPSQHLLWHYRSKHESLIAFSNSKYYENKLLTFPSTDDITSKVSFVHVEGYYDKGKTRQNSFEAKAIVDEIVHRLSDPILSKRSIGVVTFSVVQQILIEDLLNEIFSARPDIEKIALESSEPLFIKNLENVQGDERDVILFSVGYGPDQFGKISLNFGPINRDGGWRRLNVAVSRARYEMKVFSTLKADQIDIARTSSEGVAGLKAFLAYAEKGKIALPNKIINKYQQGVVFEKMLAEEIKKYGYEVDINIGSSDYRIDLGIINPANKAEYILGILCDGLNYYAAKTSRDREIIQTDVLKSLGWNIHKVWSTEWWENPEKVINETINAIKNAIQNKSIEQEEINNANVIYEKEIKHEVPLNDSLNIVPALVVPINTLAINYEISIIEAVLTSSAEDFFKLNNQYKIQAQIEKVLEIESPISKSLLSKRILLAWGISRSGSRVSAHLDKMFASLNLKHTTHSNNVFYWKHNQNADSYFIYRTTITELQKRDAEDLPPEEVANAIKEILINQVSLLQIDLIKEAARLFGFARIGNNVITAMQLGINIAIAKKYALIDNDRIIFKG